MPRSQIALDCSNVIGQVVLPVLKIGRRTLQPGLLTHPGDDANRPLRFQVELLAQIGHLHRDSYSGSIIEGPCSQVPRIEMAGDNYDLVGKFASLEIGNHVMTLDVGQYLGREYEPQLDLALGDKVCHQFRVFCAHRRGRYSRRITGIGQSSGMSETICAASCRTVERRHRAPTRSGARAIASVNYCLAISILTTTLRRELLVEFHIEQNDFTVDSSFRKRLEFIKVVNDDDRRN